MQESSVDIAEELAQVSEHWWPRVIARLNDYEIKVVKVMWFRAVLNIARAPTAKCMLC